MLAALQASGFLLVQWWVQATSQVMGFKCTRIVYKVRHVLQTTEPTKTELMLIYGKYVQNPAEYEYRILTSV